MVIVLLAHKAHAADAEDTSTLGASIARGLTLNSRITATRKTARKVADSIPPIKPVPIAFCPPETRPAPRELTDEPLVFCRLLPRACE